MGMGFPQRGWGWRCDAAAGRGEKRTGWERGGERKEWTKPGNAAQEQGQGRAPSKRVGFGPQLRRCPDTSGQVLRGAGALSEARGRRVLWAGEARFGFDAGRAGVEGPRAAG